MEATMRKLCQRHALTAIGTLYQAERFDSVTVYLHWSHSHDAVCASGSGKSFDEALVHALANMAEKRDLAAREFAEGRLGSIRIEGEAA